MKSCFQSLLAISRGPSDKWVTSDTSQRLARLLGRLLLIPTIRLDVLSPVGATISHTSPTADFWTQNYRGLPGSARRFWRLDSPVGN